MAIICEKCLDNKGLNRPPVRTGSGPCAFCGYEGARHPRTGKLLNVGNFTYPDNLIPGMPAYEKLQGPSDEGGGSGGGIRPATKGK